MKRTAVRDLRRTAASGVGEGGPGQGSGVSRGEEGG